MAPYLPFELHVATVSQFTDWILWQQGKTLGQHEPISSPSGLKHTHPLRGAQRPSIGPWWTSAKVNSQAEIPVALLKRVSSGICSEVQWHIRSPAGTSLLRETVSRAPLHL